MGLFKKAAKHHRRERKSDERAGSVDSMIIGNVLARASGKDQLDQVSQTVHQLGQLWTSEEKKNIILGMVMVDGTYPHLARMAELAPYSMEWVAELSKAASMAVAGADEAARAQEAVIKGLQKIQDRNE